MPVLAEAPIVSRFVLADNGFNMGALLREELSSSSPAWSLGDAIVMEFDKEERVEASSLSKGGAAELLASEISPISGLRDTLVPRVVLFCWCESSYKPCT